jgi:MarR family transcriptional regulator, 2-MHQ and catechol-resistance regulon repressor
LILIIRKEKTKMSEISTSSIVIWDKISKAYDKMRRVQSKQMYGQNLTAPQFGVMEVLNRLGPVPLKKISEELMVTGANITCVVDNLEKEEFVKRVPSKEDRRVILAELTPKGKEKLDQIMPEYVQNMASVISVLNDHEQKDLVKLLEKINLN